MKTINVSQAEGPVLDWLVAKANNDLHPVGNVRVLDEKVFSIEAGDYERRLLNIPSGDPSPILYGPARENSGYRGRTGIYELVMIDDTMRTMIHDGASELDLERHARTLTPSIREDGRTRVLRGETTIEEVLRVTRED